MSKIPPVYRGYEGYGLTGECAFLWATFLMHEADWNEDYIAYDKWRALAESLQPKEGKATPASVHYAALEEAIKRYAK